MPDSVSAPFSSLLLPSFLFRSPFFFSPCSPLFPFCSSPTSSLSFLCLDELIRHTVLPSPAFALPGPRKLLTPAPRLNALPCPFSALATCRNLDDGNLLCDIEDACALAISVVGRSEDIITSTSSGSILMTMESIEAILDPDPFTPSLLPPPPPSSLLSEQQKVKVMRSEVLELPPPKKIDEEGKQESPVEELRIMEPSRRTRVPLASFGSMTPLVSYDEDELAPMETEAKEGDAPKEEEMEAQEGEEPKEKEEGDGALGFTIRRRRSVSDTEGVYAHPALEEDGRRRGGRPRGGTLSAETPLGAPSEPIEIRRRPPSASQEAATGGRSAGGSSSHDMAAGWYFKRPPSRGSDRDPMMRSPGRRSPVMGSSADSDRAIARPSSASTTPGLRRSLDASLSPSDPRRCEPGGSPFIQLPGGDVAAAAASAAAAGRRLLGPGPSSSPLQSAFLQEATASGTAAQDLETWDSASPFATSSPFETDPEPQGESPFASRVPQQQLQQHQHGPRSPPHGALSIVEEQDDELEPSQLQQASMVMPPPAPHHHQGLRGGLSTPSVSGLGARTLSAAITYVDTITDTDIEIKRKLGTGSFGLVSSSSQLLLPLFLLSVSAAAAHFPLPALPPLCCCSFPSPLLDLLLCPAPAPPAHLPPTRPPSPCPPTPSCPCSSSAPSPPPPLQPLPSILFNLAYLTIRVLTRIMITAGLPGEAQRRGRVHGREVHDRDQARRGRPPGARQQMGGLQEGVGCLPPPPPPQHRAIRPGLLVQPLLAGDRKRRALLPLPDCPSRLSLRLLFPAPPDYPFRLPF